MRPEPKRVRWRAASVGVAVLGVLVGVWVLLPCRAPARERFSEEVITALDVALRKDDRAGLFTCREMLRAGLHRDLLGRSLPGLLRLVDALLQVDLPCQAERAEAFDAGVCALRQGRYQDAIEAFTALPRERGGAALAEVALGLIRARNASERKTQDAPWPSGRRHED